MMKRILTIIACSALLLSCGGNGKKFNPSERLAQADGVEAVPVQKSVVDTIGIRLSVIPPALTNEITQVDADNIALRMMQMVAANGIGNLNNAPGFALCARVTSGDVKDTGTAPQKYLATYNVYLEVVNIITGDVFASTSQEISGVGNSPAKAVSSAFNELRPTPAIQSMIADGKAKIIDWYATNLSTFKAQVENACSESNYPLALAFVESVPAEAAEVYKYANDIHSDILAKFKAQVAENELTELRSAIGAANNAYSADVYAHLMMLPVGSEQLKQGQKLVKDYEASVAAARKAKISADSLQAERQQQLDLAQMNAELTKAKYQAEASSQAIRYSLIERQDKNRGFWSSLGSRVIGLIDRVTGSVGNPSVEEIIKR